MDMRNENIKFKEGFVRQYSELTDWDKFREFSLKYLRRSIRLNTLKAEPAFLEEKLSKNWCLSKVPWCKEGFWIAPKKGARTEGRRDIGNIPEHSLGYFFIQEAASMIPPVVLAPEPEETVLDMCASPGSKATQIAQYMKNKGVLVANDYKLSRIKPLGLNLQRCGVINSILSANHGRFFSRLAASFDKILVDAPCSGTGTIRKSLKTIRIWNRNMIRRLAGTQKQLLDAAYTALKPGGTLVYSTCTLEPLEDEGVVSSLLDSHSDAAVMPISLDIRRSKPVMSFDGSEFNSQVKNCLRIWPQDNDTEGFFVAKIKKEN